MRGRLSVGDGAVGKRQSLVDSTEHPQCEGVENLRRGARIVAEPVGEIAMACRVVELQSGLKMLLGVGKVAEIPAGDARNAMSDQDFGAIRPGRRFAQEELGHVECQSGFAAGQMPHPKTVIGEPFRDVFHLPRQFAGARKGRSRFRRLISLGPDQRIAEAGL
jgi:hypothetical protein